MTDPEKANPLALLVQVEKRRDQARITAQVVVVQPDGELHAPLWTSGGFGRGAEFDGLEYGAYVDWHDQDARIEKQDVWGANASYSVHRIGSARHARRIAAVLDRIARGMDKMNKAEGHLPDDDFGAQVTRLGRILGFKTIYVRLPNRVREVSGQTYRAVTGADLQSWVAMAVQDIQNGELANYLPNRR